MPLTLAQLLGGNRAAGSVEITGLTVDSRAVRKGDLFVALPGSKFDGRRFIDDAVKSGAAAVLTLPGTAVSDLSVAVIEDPNPRRRYAEIAARFYGGQPSVEVAVTGTNGKTSVADFCRQIWLYAGYEAASLGTLGVKSERYSEPGGLTTPDPSRLHAALGALAASGVSHAAVEASSHGLDQYRLDGMSFKAAGFTNLTRDHLDYHKNEQSYFYAKARLFGELLAPGTTAVVNIDTHWGRVLDDLAWGRGLERLTVGRADDAVLRITGQEERLAGQYLSFSYDGRKYSLDLPLMGAFQADNALLAAGLVLATGVPAEIVFDALKSLQGVSGRMEFIGLTANGGAVFVDYAHTPGGLDTVLKAARAHTAGRLHVVFGCGGDRDAGKRPQMGKIAETLSDCVYVTDDNPRSEDAATIRAAILAATPGAVEIGDRAEAIAMAMAALKDGDILIVAGKGHEEGQLVGGRVIPFSDIETVKSLLPEELHHAHA